MIRFQLQEDECLSFFFSQQAPEAYCWHRSDEALDSRGMSRGRNAFSLGLGITGPELFAAARGTRFVSCNLAQSTQFC